ncbi:MAG: transporter, family, cyanate transporter [Pseudonocardiales bacterium]|jgi:CP family cyanate transporter-like MFS transporter|nr:transporter, family, cyanate transporter [Pseudonocardiales bacterium]
MPGSTSTAPRVRPAAVLVGLLALALNLRAALAGYPPLLEAVRADLGISAGSAGFVQTAAILMMAAGSFAGPALGARFGSERALTAAVALVAVGSLARGLPAAVPLVVGSVLIGFGIGLAGVLLTGMVKEYVPARAGTATGGYVVAMMVGATVASAVAVPLAVAVGGWSFALAVWAVPAVLALGAWSRVTRRVRGRQASERPHLPWRDRFSRLVACHQAAASLLVYGWMTWLAPYVASLGWSDQRAGILLGVWAVAQIPGALFLPALAERHRRWRFWSAVALGCTAVGTLGVLLVPLAPVVGPWPWAVLIGIGSGAGFPLGLAVVAWRTPDAAASASTSGMALGVGYTVAGLGPLVMGLIVDLSGGYPAAIAVLLLAVAAQAFAIARIGPSPRS